MSFEQELLTRDLWGRLVNKSGDQKILTKVVEKSYEYELWTKGVSTICEQKVVSTICEQKVINKSCDEKLLTKVDKKELWRWVVNKSFEQMLWTSGVNKSDEPKLLTKVVKNSC